MDMIRELWAYLRARRNYWLWPVFLTLLILGALIVFVEGSAVAPFLYTLF